MTISTETERVQHMEQAAGELPVNHVSAATRAALHALVQGWDSGFKQAPEHAHHLSHQLRADLHQVIQNLTALSLSLDGDLVEAERRMRKTLGLPIAVPPFNDDIYEDWRGLAAEHHPWAKADELRHVTRELYEEHQGVMPPGPLDYTR